MVQTTESRDQRDMETRRKALLASSHHLLLLGLCSSAGGLQATKHHPHHADEEPRAVKEPLEPPLAPDHEGEAVLCSSLPPYGISTAFDRLPGKF